MILGWIMEAICRLDVVEAIEHGFNRDETKMYAGGRVEVRRARRNCNGPWQSTGVCSSIRRRSWWMDEWADEGENGRFGVSSLPSQAGCPCSEFAFSVVVISY